MDTDKIDITWRRYVCGDVWNESDCSCFVLLYKFLLPWRKEKTRKHETNFQVYCCLWFELLYEDYLHFRFCSAAPRLSSLCIKASLWWPVVIQYFYFCLVLRSFQFHQTSAALKVSFITFLETCILFSFVWHKNCEMCVSLCTRRLYYLSLTAFRYRLLG